MDKVYPKFDLSNGDEPEVRVLGFVVADGDPPLVFEFAEQTLHEIAAAVFRATGRFQAAVD